MISVSEARSYGNIRRADYAPSTPPNLALEKAMAFEESILLLSKGTAWFLCFRGLDRRLTLKSQNWERRRHKEAAKTLIPELRPAYSVPSRRFE